MGFGYIYWPKIWDWLQLLHLPSLCHCTWSYTSYLAHAMSSPVGIMVVLSIMVILGHSAPFDPAVDCSGGVMCLAVYRPVCGSDGNTYSNACELGAANCASTKDEWITVVSQGACGKSLSEV
ncbi:unnamed protein product [Lymnaea stagnalis]|uniref:Kazal-like domain-containing protein n=1 Tax=Lymnaea stagnalis TaxID=6523 RepID=A0AAV2HHE8_LYMST